MAISAATNWAGESAQPLPQVAAPAPSVAVSAWFEPLRGVWQALEAQGVATPYQSYRFAESYFRHVEAPQGAKPAILTLRDDAGAVMLLAPFSVRSVGGARVARFIGGKQANFNMPLFTPAAARLTSQTLRAALVEAGRQAGIDAFCLHAQPLDWQAIANPFASLGQEAAPSQGYKLQLDGPAEAVLKRQLSKDTRRKLRQKEQRLEKMGVLASLRAGDIATAGPLLDRFLALKAERFAAMGIADPFAAGEEQGFLREGLAAGAGGRALIDIHALTLDGNPIAIFGGVADGNRYSGLFTAFDATPEIAKSSPGEILLTRMIADCAQRGIKTFDLGVGEAHYKDKFCDQTEALVEAFVPVTLKGKALAGLCLAKQRLKRLIKTSTLGQRAMALVRKARARG